EDAPCLGRRRDVGQRDPAGGRALHGGARRRPANRSRCLALDRALAADRGGRPDSNRRRGHVGLVGRRLAHPLTHARNPRSSEMSTPYLSVARPRATSTTSSRLGWRDMAVMAALIALTIASSALAALPALARSPQSPTDLTIVLVHGGFAGPEGWDTVAAGLTKDGYTVVAPRLNLLDAAEDVATVRAAL